jgi:transcriptional regulator with XRE-family HTH domain
VIGQADRTAGSSAPILHTRCLDHQSDRHQQADARQGAFGEPSTGRMIAGSDQAAPKEPRSDCEISVADFTSSVRTRTAREATRLAGVTARSIGEEVRRAREDAGLTQRQVAQAAGISQSHYAAVEAGGVAASVVVLHSIAVALGGHASLRFFPGTGPRLRDHLQAPMVEAFLRVLAPRWDRFPETVVSRPASGVIDLALADRAACLLVAAEFHSQLRRLEQQIRWARAKADGLLETSIGHLLNCSTTATTDRLLVLRSTAATRELARLFEATLTAAYPARTADVLAALAGDAPWPGSGIVWITFDEGRASVMRRQPPGVRLGS